MTRTKPRLIRRSAVVALSLAASAAALAQTSTGQPVRIVTGAAAGSTIDVVTRTLADGMAPLLGQPVIVENRPGAGGTLATAAVAAAAPDGLALNASGCSGDAITFAFVSQGRPPLALFRGLTPVGRLMRDHWLVLAPAADAAASLKEFGEKARGQAKPLPFPSQGEGSTPHLQGERLARTMGFKALHVPYKEGALGDLAGGRLAYAVTPVVSAMPLIKSGRLKALAVLSSERLLALPEVPTAHEAGLPGYTFNGGICLWAPGATPAPVLARLNRALADAARQPAVRERFEALGADPTPYTLEETVRYVTSFAAESERLRAEVFGAAR